MSSKLTPSQRRERARLAIMASKCTGDILPRLIYETAGVTPPANATDEVQRSNKK